MCSSPPSALYLACSSFIAVMNCACLATTTSSGTGSATFSTGMGNPTATNIGLGRGRCDLHNQKSHRMSNNDLMSITTSKDNGQLFPEPAELSFWAD